MADFAPPSGPPPPRVPEGWKAVWNSQYEEWFFVNLYTKQSTWEKPTEPAYPGPGNHAPPGGALPGYSSGPNNPVVSDTKIPLDSNNPYAHETDEQMAARLQAEEQRRLGGISPGGGYPQQPYGYDQSQEKSSGPRGLLSKLLGKSKSSGGQHYGGGYPQQHYGGYPQQGYYPPQGGYGGYQGRPQRQGMGAGGAAALGVGGGLLGGMMLGQAMDGGDGGGDYGGGDYGGGDYGGGDGGGDGGGGDGGGGGGD